MPQTRRGPSLGQGATTPVSGETLSPVGPRKRGQSLPALRVPRSGGSAASGPEVTVGSSAAGRAASGPEVTVGPLAGTAEEPQPRASRKEQQRVMRMTGGSLNDGGPSMTGYECTKDEAGDGGKLGVGAPFGRRARSAKQ